MVYSELEREEVREGGVGLHECQRRRELRVDELSAALLEHSLLGHVRALWPD